MKKIIIALFLSLAVASTVAAHEPPERFITVKLKQSRFSLNLLSHAKDAMNSMVFKLPVSERFYREVRVGDDLAEDKFRWGSLLVDGSVGNWNIIVTSK